MDWQNGEFERHANLELIIPVEVLMICRLLDLTPKALVEEFLDDLSKGYSVTGESESNHLSEYFLRKDFGEIKFSVENIWLMLVELNAPFNGIRVINMYGQTVFKQATGNASGIIYLNTAGWKKGVYILIGDNGAEHVTRKFLIQ